MTKKLLSVALLAVCLSAHAQYISPTDLFQMYKLWQVHDPHADKNTYDYLLTVDKHWIPHGQPTINENGYSSLIGYSMDFKDWYLTTEYEVVLDIDPRTSKRNLAYRFRENQTWFIYTSQMERMGAVKLGSGPAQGGQQTIYEINGIGISLIEYPPGINGDDKTYQVTLMPGDQ